MKLKIVTLAVMLFIAHASWAHEVSKGPNGGRVVEAGPYHVEMVVQEKAVNVFLTDANDKSIGVTGFKGIAILTISGKAQRIVLEPKDATRLSGASPVALPTEPNGVVQLTGPDGKTAQGRFH